MDTAVSVATVGLLASHPPGHHPAPVMADQVKDFRVEPISNEWAIIEVTGHLADTEEQAAAEESYCLRLDVR